MLDNLGLQKLGRPVQGENIQLSRGTKGAVSVILERDLGLKPSALWLRAFQEGRDIKVTRQPCAAFGSGAVQDE